ncbi:hypothetical protein N9A25_00320, partial [bacterium]|nr:hypothetical protein [bacterium]
TGNSGVINLPALSTVDGELIIDPNKTFFKEVQVDNDQVIVASDFVDSLNLISGTAIQMTVDSGAESITIDNTGVTQLTGSTGISVSAATGNITLSNTGVTSVSNSSTLPSGLSAGAGLAADATTGSITLTNTGVIDVDAGFGITISRDDATGIVTVTNAAPAQVAFRTFRVSGQNDIVADSTSDTLTIVNGYGIINTTDAGTDTLTISVDPTLDITGSVFANDSTLLVDANAGRIVADVYADVFGNVTGNTTGYHTGDVKGSIFGDDSSKIVDAVENIVYANELWGTLRSQTWTAEYNDFLTIRNDGTLDTEYNNGAISNVVGDGSDFFKREVTTNGVRIMGAGTVGGQTAVPDAWLEKVARMFELFTDPNGAGINEEYQRNLIKTLSGDTGTYHAGLPTLQRVARGAGADYSPNFLTDQGIIDWNLTNLFDTHVANDMVWYLNSTGSGYGDGDQDAQEVIEHVFHTLHMHGLPADDMLDPLF